MEGYHRTGLERSRIEPKPPLTKREDDCMRLLCQGKGYDEIAKELFISKSTVHTHLNVIYRRLNVQNRVQAVVAYITK